MAITKYQSYYLQLIDILEEMKKVFEYSNLSQAYTHWFLENYFNLSKEHIQEVIIDGSGDNGIDAIIYDEDQNMFTAIQTKLPGNQEKINSEVSQADINATIRGVQALLNIVDPVTPNAEFLIVKQELKDQFISKVEIIFLTFNNGIKGNIEIIDNFCTNTEEETGTKFVYEIFNKQNISNLFEKINRTNSTEVILKYKWNQKAYDLEDREIDSYISVINGMEIANSLKDELLVIFDENIRLLESNSKINSQMKSTASTEDSDMFYFYNNGIVFICDEAMSSVNNTSLKLKGASIVNGCQTVNSLVELSNAGSLKDNVDILVRTIVIKDYEQRVNITRFLNSQNPVKDSYLISNNSVIRELQKKLLEKGFYLERQINEVQYKRSYGEEIETNLIILKLDNTIQRYVGYSNNSYAATAKRGKGALFNPDNIDSLISNINAAKVIEAHNIYTEIAKIITQYRKFRRNQSNTEFSDFLKINNSSLQDEISDYLFMNTSDILLLNSVNNFKRRLTFLNVVVDLNDIKDINNLIYNSILICKKIISKEVESPAAQTKSSTIFKKVQENISQIEIKDYEIIY